MKQGIKASISLAVIASLILGGCSSMSVETKKIDYKSAGKVPPLEIPPDLTKSGPDERYTVPDVSPRGSATLSTYTQERQGRPAQSNGTANLLPDLANVYVERAGAQRWLVVKASPEQVWPVVREFWQELGFIIKTEQPEAGIMETDWAEDRAKIPQDAIRNVLGKILDSVYSTGERDKFRTRLEPGKQAGTTEVYISHRGMIEVLEEGTGDINRAIWQPRPSDPELEAEMLRRLMVRFGVEETRSQTLLASGKDVERARLSRGPGGETALVLNDAFDRGWRRVGLALDRVGFTVVDRDRSQGIYYVRYIDPQTDVEKKKDDGWFSKLAFWRSDDKKVQPEQFRIVVADSSEGTQVSMQDKSGAPDKSDTAGKILALLYDQLK
jgi:outer membrane protein assembly factor BamC